MSDTNTKPISERYRQEVFSPLRSVLRLTERLLPLLAALPDDDKTSLSAAMQAIAAKQGNKGAAADTLATLPELAHNLAGLDELFRPAAESAAPTNAQTAAGGSSELLDRFRASVSLLNAALKEVPKNHAEIRSLTSGILEHCAQLQPARGTGR